VLLVVEGRREAAELLWAALCPLSPGLRHCDDPAEFLTLPTGAEVLLHLLPDDMRLLNPARTSLPARHLRVVAWVDRGELDALRLAGPDWMDFATLTVQGDIDAVEGTPRLPALRPPLPERFGQRRPRRPAPLSEAVGVEGALARLFVERLHLEELHALLTELPSAEALRKAMPPGASLPMLAQAAATQLGSAGQIDAVLFRALLTRLPGDEARLRALAAQAGVVGHWAPPERRWSPAIVPAPSLTGLPWDLFIAFPAPARDRARQLVGLLGAELRVFFDERLDLGPDWDTAIDDALHGSAVFVIVLSRPAGGGDYLEGGARKSPYLRDELRAAIGKARTDEGWTRVIPLFLDGPPRPGERVPYGLGIHQGLALGPELSLQQAATRLREDVRRLALRHRLASALERLLSTTEELCELLAGLPRPDPIDPVLALPDSLAPLPVAARAAVLRLEAGGLIGPTLLQALAARSPEGPAIARRLAELYGVDLPIIACAPLFDETPLRDALRHEASRIPRLFWNADGAVLTHEVYVEVGIGGQDRASRPDNRARLIDVLDRGDRRLWQLAGEPGAGKSTLLKMTTLDLLDRAGGPLPLLLSLSALMETELWPAVDAAYGPGSGAVAKRAVEAGRAALLLDGFDEVLDPAAGGARKAEAAVTRAAREMGRCPVVVAGRPAGFKERSLEPLFTPLLLLPLQEDAQRQLLHKRLHDEALEEATLVHLKDQPELRGNPLLLTLLALLVQERQRVEGLPTHKVGLYSQALDALLVEHPESKETDGKGACLRDPTLARRALSRVALALHGTPGDRLPTRDVLGILAREGIAEGAAAEGLLTEIEQVTGLLERRQSRSDLLFFPHRTLREHLAAVRLDERLRAAGIADSLVEETLSRAGRGGWGEVFGQVVALLGGHGGHSGEAAPRPDLVEALVERVVADGGGLAYELVAAADTLPTDLLYRLLQMDRSRSAWQNRQQVLERLWNGELVSDPAVLVGLIDRYRKTTRHGVDLFWCLHILDTVAVKEGLDLDVRRAAERARESFFDHIAAEDLVAAEATLDGWWRPCPPLNVSLPFRSFNGRTADDLSNDSFLRGPPNSVVFADRFQIAAQPINNLLYERFDPEHRTERAPDRDEDAVVNLSWWEAVAFARWVGAALPTAQEWECAAIADGQRRFWTDSPEDDPPPADVEKVKQLGRGASEQGRDVNAWGVAGIPSFVWEWTCEANRMDGLNKIETAELPPVHTVGGPAAKRVALGRPQHDIGTYRNRAGRISRNVEVYQYWPPDARQPEVGFRLVLPSRPRR
jgi:formylglycine-generating enzyme required for sulfatase activity